MTDNEKITMLEETFDVEEGFLKPNMVLEDIEEYDSMTKLSLIVMIDDKFGKKLSGSDIKAFKTVKDIMDIMEKK